MPIRIVGVPAYTELVRRMRRWPDGALDPSVVVPEEAGVEIR